jgi:hypothetical protein
MIAHATQIVVKELNRQFAVVYSSAAKVELGNIAMGVGTGVPGEVPKDKIILTIVNYKEEKTLKNVPGYRRDDAALKVTYENPPVFLNLLMLLTATHASYNNGLLDLSRVIRLFQAQSFFTPDNIPPASYLNPGAPSDKEIDQLESFKLIFDLYSPSIEEINQLFGILGGRQYPFVMYMMRMLELKFKSVQRESGLITEIQSDFFLKN